LPRADPASEHRDVVVTEVPEQPPEPRGAAGRALVVGDDEDSLADPGPTRGGCERLRARARMPSSSLDAETYDVERAERYARREGFY